MNDRIAQLPDEERARLGDVSFTRDAMVITTPQVGKIELAVEERTPSSIVMGTKNFPVPIKLRVTFTEKSADSTEVQGFIDADIPVMLKPLAGPMLQKCADQFGNLFSRLA
ncbi:MAG: hypothetical protein J6C67_02570 [Muribaculaceae bacterium]|nr:hypothetical protein [Muribaculaceae bacterium]